MTEGEITLKELVRKLNEFGVCNRHFWLVLVVVTLFFLLIWLPDYLYETWMINFIKEHGQGFNCSYTGACRGDHELEQISINIGVIE